MGVRFDPAARRAIVAATAFAEANGRPRPAPHELVAAVLRNAGGPLADLISRLGVEVTAVMSAMERAGLTDPGLAAPARGVATAIHAEPAEALLRDAWASASTRSAGALTDVDVLIAAVTGDGPIAGVLREAGLTVERLRAVAGSSANEPAATAAVSRGTALARIGIGYDSHRFGETGELILGGVTIPGSARLVGHSDGDAIAHAITDAILGAAAAGDIGEMFSDTDDANRGRNSIEMLRAAVRRIDSLGLSVHQVDATVVAERPRISPYRDAMRSALAGALGISPERVSIKGKTNEGMGWIGRGEGIACVAVATLVESAPR